MARKMESGRDLMPRVVFLRNTPLYAALIDTAIVELL